MTQKENERYRKYRSQGLCGKCGKTCFMNSHLCEHHYKIYRRAKIKYQIKHNSRLVKERKEKRKIALENGKCVNCFNNELYSVVYCKDCLQRYNELKRNRRRVRSEMNMSAFDLSIKFRELVTDW